MENLYYFELKKSSILNEAMIDGLMAIYSFPVNNFITRKHCHWYNIKKQRKKALHPPIVDATFLNIQIENLWENV